MIRTDAGLSVSRFAELINVPRRTYTSVSYTHLTLPTNGCV